MARKKIKNRPKTKQAVRAQQRARKQYALRKLKTQYTLAALLFVGFFALLFTIRSMISPHAVKIGLIAELTSDTPAVGLASRNAATMLVNDINHKGGLKIGAKHYPVQLSVIDNHGNIEDTRAAVLALIKEGVVAIVGPNASRYAIAAAKVAEKNKIVLISPWSTDPKTTLDEITGRPKRYVFRAAFTDPYQGSALATFAFRNLNARRAAILFDATADVLRGQAEYFQKTFSKEGGQIVVLETYMAGDKNFVDQITKVRNAKPDVVFLPSSYTDAAAIVRQAKAYGVKAPFLGSDAWASANLLAACGASCEGYYLSAHYSAHNQNPTVQAFVVSYKNYYDSVPDDVAALTYDSLGLVFHALQQTKRINREAVRAGLAKTTKYQGVTGVISYKDSGDPAKNAVILQIVKGNFTWFANAQAPKPELSN